MNKRGFTLIELLVVIAIIAVLVAFAATNYVGVRSRAKDIRKKAELTAVKGALRLFYNDNAVYPGPATTSTNTFSGCGNAATPNEDCLTTCNGAFAAGATDCDTVYMKLLPPETDYEWNYRQVSSGDDFCLWTMLENGSDEEIAKSQSKCSVSCGAIVADEAFVLCTD
jgi:prepilin-type N-terminal cleavage/methylation domain-containing protein